MGCFGGALVWGVFGYSGVFSGVFGCFRVFWGLLGLFWGCFGFLWGCFGGALGCFGVFWGVLRRVLGDNLLGGCGGVGGLRGGVVAEPLEAPTLDKCGGGPRHLPQVVLWPCPARWRCKSVGNQGNLGTTCTSLLRNRRNLTLSGVVFTENILPTIFTTFTDLHSRRAGVG